MWYVEKRTNEGRGCQMDDSLIKRFINGVCRAKCSDPRGWEPTRDEYTDIGFKAGFYALVHGHNEEAFMRDFIRFWSDYNDWKQRNR